MPINTQLTWHLMAKVLSSRVASNQEILNRELTSRLSMTMSLSALPFVEEWMDTHMARWIEGVPMPTEMPEGHVASFLVGIASDVNALTWTAHGNPDGYVVKLVDYLKREKVSKSDIELLETLGGGLDPKLVGSWIRVEGKDISKGWHFYGAQPFEKIASMLSDSPGTTLLNEWLDKTGVDTFTRFAQGVGKESTTEIEFLIPGVSIDDQINKLSSGFESLTGMPLSDNVKHTFALATEPAFAISVKFSGGRVVLVSAIAPSIGDDELAELAKKEELPWDLGLGRARNALQAGQVERVSYQVSDRKRLEVYVTPGSGGTKERSTVN